MFTTGPPEDDDIHRLICRVEAINGIPGHWGRSIVEQGDGKSVQEILDVLYNEELAKGAWLSDIGIWRGLFDRCAMETISDLACRGFISLEPGP